MTDKDAKDEEFVLITLTRSALAAPSGNDELPVESFGTSLNSKGINKLTFYFKNTIARCFDRCFENLKFSGGI